MWKATTWVLIKKTTNQSPIIEQILNCNVSVVFQDTMINDSISTLSNNIIRGKPIGGIFKLPEGIPVTPTQVRNLRNNRRDLIHGSRSFPTTVFVGITSPNKGSLFGVGNPVVLPNLELNSVVGAEWGFLFWRERDVVVGWNRVGFWIWVGLLEGLGGVVWVVVVLHYSDLLDLFGDVGDGRFGLGAFEGEPDGDEEEEEDYGGADADSEDNPEAETEDGGGVR